MDVHACMAVANAKLLVLPPVPVPPVPQKFDPGQHKLLCEELKHLYTAITRAKNSVVIYDENATAR